MDIQNTRLQNGITNVSEVSLFEALKKPFEMLFHTFLDDFDTFTAANWTITETSGSATQALTDGAGGWLLISNTAGNNDLVSMQNSIESFNLVAGQRLFFEARLAVDDATLSDVLVGLLSVTATPFSATDGIYFVKPEAAATINFVSEVGDAATTATAVASMADDTFITLGFYYDGNDKIVYAVNGQVLGAITPTSLTELLLTPTIAVRNGSAAERYLTVDYVYVAQERTGSASGAYAVPSPS